MLVDYLYTLPQVDKEHIALNGYSRDGKMALVAAILDPRIAAVIPGSTGVGGVMPWRLGSERGFGESIESTTRNFPTWFVPRLRFFSGREDRLPVDGNSLVALVAPRALLITYGNNDEVSQPWPMEQAYRSALRAYDLLGKSDALGIMHSPGYHGANDVQAAMNWLDFQFGRSKTKWTNEFVYPWDYDKWKAQVKETVTFPNIARANSPTLSVSRPWEKTAADIRKSVEWMLGDKTPGTLASPFPLPKLGDTSQPAAPPRAAEAELPPRPAHRRCSTTSTAQKPAAIPMAGSPRPSRQTTKRKITFPSPSGFGAIEADLFTPNNARSRNETAGRHLAAWLQFFARL